MTHSKSPAICRTPLVLTSELRLPRVLLIQTIAISHILHVVIEGDADSFGGQVFLGNRQLPNLTTLGACLEITDEEEASGLVEVVVAPGTHKIDSKVLYCALRGIRQAFGECTRFIISESGKFRRQFLVVFDLQQFFEQVPDGFLR